MNNTGDILRIHGNINYIDYKIMKFGLEPEYILSDFWWFPDYT